MSSPSSSSAAAAAPVQQTAGQVVVGCGACSAHNAVAHGVEQFRCYNCGALVLVPAIINAQFVPGMQIRSLRESIVRSGEEMDSEYVKTLQAGSRAVVLQAGTGPTGRRVRVKDDDGVEGWVSIKTQSGDWLWGGARQNSAPPSVLAAGLAPERGASSNLLEDGRKNSSLNFFGKLQKTAEKTMQQVEKTFEGITSTSSADSFTKPAKSADSFSKPAKSAEFTKGDGALQSEEDQLQWAINESLREASQARPAPTTDAGDGGLQAAAAQVASRLQAAEQRREGAEQRLAAARAREVAAEAERGCIRVQLQENQAMINGLTEQLDAMHAKIQAKKCECEELELAVASGGQGAGSVPADGQGDLPLAVASDERGAGSVPSGSRGDVAQAVASGGQGAGGVPSDGQGDVALAVSLGENGAGSIPSDGQGDVVFSAAFGEQGAGSVPSGGQGDVALAVASGGQGAGIVAHGEQGDVASPPASLLD